MNQQDPAGMASSQGPALGSSSAPPQSPIPQLPPQMFTTAASLLDLSDKKLTVVLRDGRKVIGVLRSWDQFGNLVLQDAVERVFASGLYADVARGLYLVRGENVMLMGEIDLDREDVVPAPWREGEVSEVLELQKREVRERKDKDVRRAGRMKRLGFEGETSGEAIL